ncbi:MAG: sigma 54-interacting transcriptional regulator, partial [Deltaproteobacteria bacterium]|nr:sigma 54-interacting transcriptional regulator [Deltaproteobacteria bacterium]
MESGYSTDRNTPPSGEPEQLVGSSTAMQALRNEIAAAASLPSTVRITGETGAGKGVVARTLHRLSSRSNEPFVHVDCAALSSEIVESELFGHERGAFTG